ncbi:hypothetical protein TRICI_002895 [Trichomonascus ciferrii]|uniref:Extracellular membrane protein CFEM domain-containing protein n=1 Tax=Trichomonascus ciferrii TaxID=44093 RepID=A0A642V4M1_9ASCO|nr:hypothetical protein TRICI_002895 [Trichomonascus ciferrii]
MFKSILLAATVATSFVAAQQPGGDISVQCHQTCKRALNAYNRCKGPGLSNCICGENSQFRSLSEQCLDCGEGAWYRYGHGLQYPLNVCNIDVPFPELPSDNDDDEEEAEDAQTTNKVSARPTATSAVETSTSASASAAVPSQTDDNDNDSDNDDDDDDDEDDDNQNNRRCESYY